MRKVLLQLSLIVAVLWTSTGCGYKYYLNSGKEDYGNLEYASARDNFNTALQKRPESFESLRMLAQTLQKLNDYEGAEKAYKLAMAYPQVTLDDKLNYGRMLMSNAKHKDAELIFKDYLNARPDDKMALTLLQSCQFIELFKDDTSKYKIESLPMLNNLSMYSPVPYEDGVVYTAERLLKGQKNPWTGNAYNDIHFMKMKDGNWTDGGQISELFNQKYNDGPISFNKAGNEAVFTRSSSTIDGRKRQANKENINNLYLYSASKKDTTWTDLKALPFNSEEYTCMHPALSATGDTLYFSSDKKGGQGGFDLYRSIRAAGVWTSPENLGAIVNTPGNEVFPTMGPDGEMYFSSNGHPTLGELDIFKTSYVDGKWKKPRKMNYPVNSSSDDFALVMLSADSIGYFTSNKSGVDKIYEVKRRPSGIVTVDGTVTDAEGNPMEGVTLKLINKDTEEVLQEIVTGPDGKFDFDLLSERNYRIEASKEGYFTESYERSTMEQYRDETEKVDFAMREIIVTNPNEEYKKDEGGVYEVSNIYYDYNEHYIRTDAALELDKLVRLMKDNPTVSIELYSHTDAQGEDGYNMGLSQRRAKSVVDYLVKKGISSSRLSSKGFGETKIINRCKNDVECSDEEHEKNRRTEFIVTQQ